LPLFSQTIDGVITDGEYSSKRTFNEGRFTLSWIVKEKTAFFALSAETTGWIAIGIDPATLMENSDMIFCWVDDTGRTYIVNAYATGPYFSHPPDEELGGTNDILELAGIEKDGKTTIDIKRKKSINLFSGCSTDGWEEVHFF